MLNQLWTQYINDLTSTCKSKTQADMAPLLLKADLHGAKIKGNKKIGHIYFPQIFFLFLKCLS